MACLAVILHKSPKSKPAHPFLQTSNTYTAGVPLGEVGVGGWWGAAGPEMLAG
jgi:hypothetical protein